MALKKGSTGNVDLHSLIVAWKEFERVNNIEITLDGRLSDGSGRLDVVWTATAWDGDPSLPAAKRLASANVGCLSSRLTSMEAVLFQLMYALDFRIALREFGSEAHES